MWQVKQDDIHFLKLRAIFPEMAAHKGCFFPPKYSHSRYPFTMSVKKITKLVPQTTALFVCDVQEVFKGLIWQYPSVISVAGKMVKNKRRYIGASS